YRLIGRPIKGRLTMLHVIRRSILAAAVLLPLSLWLFAQTPTGIITGIVKDQSGGVVTNDRVTVLNKETGLTREVLSGPGGSFGAPALPAGNYEVRAVAIGLKTVMRLATVETGSTTSMILTMDVGASMDVITVEAAAANINYESNTVQGVVTPGAD